MTTVPGPAPALTAPAPTGSAADAAPSTNGTGALPPHRGGPTIANGNTAANNAVALSPRDHSRKSSVTISAAGTSGQMPNGGPVAGKPAAGNGIQFGSMNATDSPGATQSTPGAPVAAPPAGQQPLQAPPVGTPSNPRITSPATSPSPIPQPPASGGRPPSSLHGHGNGLSFGSLGGDDASRRGSVPAAMTPNMQNAAHVRRESTPSHHGGDMNGMGYNGGRGGYPHQGGRGRGYPHQPYGQQMPYSPNNSFRAPNAPRGGQGMPSPFVPSRGMAPGYPQPPHQATRSPSMTASQPIHPAAGQMPMQNPQMPQQPYYNPGMPQQVKPSSLYASPAPAPAPAPVIEHIDPRTTTTLLLAPYAPFDLSPSSGNFEQLLMQSKQGPMYGQYDPNYAYYGAQAYPMQHGMPMQQQFVPQSPRPQYPGQPPQHYVPGQYNQHQPQPMSRTSSGVSDRPPSTVSQGPPNLPAGPGHQPSASRGTNSPAPKSSNNFQIPQRKSAGIVIKDPNSGAVKTFEKAAPSPVPAKSPASTSAAPTPPPGPKTPSHVETAHVRTDSQTMKSNSEKAQEMAAAVKRKIEDDNRREREAEQAKAATGKKSEVVEEPKSEPKPVAASVDALAEDVGKLEVAEEEPAKPTEPATEAPKPAEPAAEASKPADEKKDVPPEEDQDSDEYWARIEAEEAAREAEREAAYEKRMVGQRAEKAKREAEEAARLDEEMKKAEREAEEAEEARIKKLADGGADEEQKQKDTLFASLQKSDHAFQPTKTSTETPPGIETPDESGAATPVSQGSSMGPPPRTTATKPKPPSLKLESTKQVEPPQPSAALQSLRSARFLTAINDATYPSAIASPNPALNSAAPSGKFRYDKDFLLQFQKVFTEKPSETWNDKVKETVGDTSETPASARSGRGAGAAGSGRQGSHRGPGSVMPGAGFNSGPFGSFSSSGRTLPPGTTSAARFEASNKQPPMRYQPNAGGFPMGFPSASMSRTASSTSLGHPQSPRNDPSRRGDRGSKRGKRENEKDAKTMPLTAGMDIKPIAVSESGWKPMSLSQNSNMAGPPPSGDTYLAPDVVQRKVKASLNKMTPSTFDRISDQILAIVAQSQKETDGRTLRQVIGLTFEKATDEAHWAAMYANFCSKMLGFVQGLQPEIKDETLPLDKNGKVNAGGTLFRKYLLNRCQQDFEAGWQAKLPPLPDGGDGSKEAVMLSDEYYTAAAAKRRGLGLVRFIGELYKLGMLTSRIMHMCVKKLVDFDGMPDEAEVESLASLLKTVGGNLDSEEKARPSMDAYFDRINAMVNLEGLPSRMRFMLLDIVDLRKAGWRGKDTAKGPATLEEIRAQAAQADREKEAQRAADNSRGRGGGGRMGLGRGDVRQFSGGGHMPPPQSNTVGMDDLRRLGRGGSRQASSQGPVSLGPTSMFGPRGSNPRKAMGGAGLLGRGGEDSGASSRTGTPPAGKDKKDTAEATSTNAFSALAGLGDSNEKDEHPGSPPSQSPPVANARTVTERQRSKSPLKGEEKP